MTTIPRLVNLTPHPIRLLAADGTVLCELPTAPIPARCREIPEDAGHLRLGTKQAAIPLVRIGFGEVTGLPAPQPGTWHIVSRLVADALPERSDLLVPHDVVRDVTGQIIGCRSLAIGASHRPEDEA